jgi:FkbM family methyltransferase
MTSDDKHKFMNLRNIFVLFNRLYKLCSSIYRPIYFAYKYWSDREKIGLIRAYVTPGMKVLDVGANIGFYTILLSKLVGKGGIVYAFEPDEDNFKFLERLTKKHANVKPVNAACGEKSGVTYLYKSKEMNIDHQVYDSGESRDKIPVKMVALDDYLKEEKQRIDFVKIDVQGYDCHVFRGMKETIARSKEMLVIGELWPYGLKKAGSSAEEYLSEVKRRGFDVKVLSNAVTNDYNLYSGNKWFYVDFAARSKK